MDSKSDKPRTNLAEALGRNFEQEQARFLQAQMNFKSGYVFHGTVAASLLTSMFYLIPAARYIAKDEPKATLFVDSLDSFRQDIITFGKLKGVDNLTPEKKFDLNDDYMELDNRFDKLVREFYKIMYETGFSP
jgi:hypothetical protein